MAERAIVIVFAKAPVPGQVKTRLTPPLTPEQAAAVHEASLRDVMAAALRTGMAVQVHYAAGDGALEYFRAAFPSVRAVAQTGGDLGRRMESAFETAFGGGIRRTVIIGSDSPTLPSSDLGAAARAITPHTVVLGPAADGGYYLVGLHADDWSRARAMFRNIAWSTSSVLRATFERLSGSGLAIELLRPWYDIDRIGDLRTAAVHANPGSHLAELLESDGLLAAITPSGVAG